MWIYIGVYEKEILSNSIFAIFFTSKEYQVFDWKLKILQKVIKCNHVRIIELKFEPKTLKTMVCGPWLKIDKLSQKWKLASAEVWNSLRAGYISAHFRPYEKCPLCCVTQECPSAMCVIIISKTFSCKVTHHLLKATAGVRGSTRSSPRPGSGNQQGSRESMSLWETRTAQVN